MASSKAIDVHKALADDTRFRLYRYLGLSGRAVSVRELSSRLGLHPNTLRPHLRRLEDAGLVARDHSRASGVGRPQTLYSAAEQKGDEAAYRLMTEILCGLATTKQAKAKAESLARDWGLYLITQDRPKPGSAPAPNRNLAILQEAMARAGFDPRFRRGRGGRVDITFRDCPARELAEEHAEIVCALHRGLVEGMLGGVTPPMALKEFASFAAGPSGPRSGADRANCRVVAAAAK